MNWKDLSIRDRAAIIRQSVSDGIYNLGEIKNRFDDGSWLNKLEDVFAENARIVENRTEDKKQKEVNVESQKKNNNEKIGIGEAISILINKDSDSIINKYNNLSDTSKKRALEVALRAQSTPSARHAMLSLINYNIFRPRNAKRILDYINGTSDELPKVSNEQYNGMFGYDGVFFNTEPIQNDLIDAAVYNTKINPVIGKQINTNNGSDFGQETDFILRNYPLLSKNIQYIETGPIGFDENQDNIVSVGLIGGGNGTFKTGLPNFGINNAGYSLEGGIRNDSLFVRGWDVQDYNKQFQKDWVVDNIYENQKTNNINKSLLKLYDIIDTSTYPVVSRTPWVYFENLRDIINPYSGRTRPVILDKIKQSGADDAFRGENRKYVYDSYDFAKGGDKDTINHPKYNAKQVNPMYDYLRENGLTNEQASGILGNIAVESYLNADMKQIKGPAYGLIQAEGPRKKAMLEYNETPYSFGSGLSPEEQQQLDYIIDKGVQNYTPGEWGMSGFSGARQARNAFLNVKTTKKASDIITRNYLRPSRPAYDRRRKMSDYYYNTQKERIPYQIEFWNNPLKSWEEK